MELTMGKNGDEYLTGRLLVAMPGLEDPNFAKTVVYICAHSEEGAMGLVINRPMEALTFPEMLDQLNIPHGGDSESIQVQFGGPVEAGRGFVLHTSDYLQESTLPIDDQVSLTATIDILKAIAEGRGPDHCLLTLGYAGWSPGQLDDEMLANGWLTVDPDENLIFDPDLDHKWDRAIEKLGIDLTLLSADAGHA